MIKAIIFDYGGVISKKAGWDVFCMTYAEKYNVNKEEFLKIVHENWGKAKINQMNSSFFWKNVAKFLKISEEQLKSDANEYHYFNPAMLEIAKQLKQNYKIALLSNHIEDWLEETIIKYKLNEVFEIIVTSYNTGFAKPDKEIYLKILEKLNLKPEECLFIDDFERNIKAAKALNINCIHFQNENQFREELKIYNIKL